MEGAASRPSPILPCSRQTGASRLLGIRDDREDVVCVVDDMEIEAVVAIDPALPDIVHPAVFLRVDRGVAEVGLQKGELLAHLRFDLRR